MHTWSVLSAKLEAKYKKVCVVVCLCGRAGIPGMRCLWRMNSWLEKNIKMSYLNCYNQKREISLAVADVGEIVFSPNFLFTEGIKCPLIDLAWFRLGSAPQCCTQGRPDSHLPQGSPDCSRLSQIKI